jgi:hypothetical protein
MRTVAEALRFEADGVIRYEGQEFVIYVLTRERGVDGGPAERSSALTVIGDIDRHDARGRIDREAAGS